MPSKVLVTAMDGQPKQIVLADHGTDFSPTSANDLRVTSDGSSELDVQLDLTSLASDAARQSAKFDFGLDRAGRYHVRVAMEFAVAPTIGGSLDIYLAPSQTATAGNGNPANVTGTDSVYSGYSSNLSDSLSQLIPIGSALVTTQATTTVQIAEAALGDFTPPTRYGSVIVVNNTDQALVSDAVEMHVVLDPIVDEAQ